MPSAPRVALEPEILTLVVVLGVGVWILLNTIFLRFAASWVARVRANFGIAFLIALTGVFAGGAVNFGISQLSSTNAEPEIVQGPYGQIYHRPPAPPGLGERIAMNLPGMAVSFILIGVMSGAMIRNPRGYPIGFNTGMLVSLVQVGLCIAFGVILALGFYAVFTLMS